MPILAEKVSQRTGASMVRVQEVVSGYNNQIRHLPAHNENEKAASLALLMGTIAQVARDYGARVAIDPMTYKECVKFVLKKFSYLSLEEIREAYRMWAAEETEAKGSAMYGGEFNTAHLGKVLSAYAKMRRPILGNYLREAEDSQFQRDQKAHNEKLKQRFDRDFPKMIAAARETMQSFEEVPEFWYKSAMDREMMRVELSEMHAIKGLAKHVTIIIAQRGEQVSEALQRKVVKSEQGFEARTKVNARKISVWIKLIQNDRARITNETLAGCYTSASEIPARLQRKVQAGSQKNIEPLAKTAQQ